MADRELYDALMQGRERKIEEKDKATGKKHLGGMFDIIFRGRKKRENELDAVRQATE